ncbi:MAG: isochorismatase family protein [Anaerolineales bacterium]|nr:isochorismatase family protein [Anaerolineales bacterium]
MDFATLRKKEAYFNPAILDIKSLEMANWLAPYSQNHSTIFIPERSALLILDMQAYFLHEPSHAYIPSATSILAGINALIRVYGERNLPVFFTRHINTTHDAGLMAGWWRELIVEENPLSEIDPRVQHANGKIIKKSRYDAFYDTPLESLLRTQDILQVVICGVMTHLCCETTARSAFMRGFEVFFTIDGTATYNEAFHRAALLNLTHGFARPVLIKEILAAFERKS